MFQHDHHECAGAISLTFTYTTVVLEVLLLKVAECMGRGKLVWLTF